MKQTALIATILLFISFTAQGVIGNPIEFKNAEQAYKKYVEQLKQHDVYITLPPNFAPASIRGLSEVKSSLGNGEENINLHCMPIDIGAIVEDDSCKVAICYPQIMLDVPGKPEPIYLSTVHGGRLIEADLRMINQDMHLDVRPLIKIIAEEDMSQYANADTVVIYQFAVGKRFMDSYTCGIGICLRKKNHPAMLLRVMYNRDNEKDKDKFIREALDNIRFGDNPSDTFVEFEKKLSILPDLTFPSEYPVFTGLLPDINNETLDELNRVKAWCEEHGMKELPKVDDDMLEALNRYRESQNYHYTIADSILNSDMPDNKKILKPFMCTSRAQFPGDEKFMNKYWGWLEKNLIYPKKALDKRIQGNVLVEFTVCADGSINDIAISNISKNADESLKHEAIRLFESMPRWTPATYKDKPVNSREIRLVKFELPQNKPRIDHNQQATKHVAEETGAFEYIYDMKGIPVSPKFNGGPDGLEKWIQDNIQYPSVAAKANIEGRVIVEFIINKDGSVTNPKILRGINEALNVEAIRVIKSLPRWTPGYADGRPVTTRYVYPVKFLLAKAK